MSAAGPFEDKETVDAVDVMVAVKPNEHGIHTMCGHDWADGNIEVYVDGQLMEDAIGYLAISAKSQESMEVLVFQQGHNVIIRNKFRTCQFRIENR